MVTDPPIHRTHPAWPDSTSLQTQPSRLYISSRHPGVELTLENPLGRPGFAPRHSPLAPRAPVQESDLRGGGVFLVLRRGCGPAGLSGATRHAASFEPRTSALASWPSSNRAGGRHSVDLPLDPLDRVSWRAVGACVRPISCIALALAPNTGLERYPSISSLLYEAPGSRKNLRARSGDAHCLALASRPRLSSKAPIDALIQAASCGMRLVWIHEVPRWSRLISALRICSTPSTHRRCVARFGGTWVDGIETSVSFDPPSPEIGRAHV